MSTSLRTTGSPLMRVLSQIFFHDHLVAGASELSSEPRLLLRGVGIEEV